MACLTDIVGVTKSVAFPFYDEIATETQEAIIESASGLYMDNLGGGIDLNSIETLETMNAVLAAALQAREQASIVLEQELLVAMTARYQAAKTKFIGDIGRPSVSNNLGSTGEIQGMRLRAIMPIAGTILINRISLCVNASKTFSIYIGRCETHSEYIEQVMYVFPITTVAGNFSQADMSGEPNGISLPLEINGVEQEYYVYWKRSEADNAQAKDNDIRCMTCGSKAANRAIDQFLYTHGVSIPSTTELHRANADSKAHGLRVQCVIGCDNAQIICREYNKKDAVQLLMNWAALYKSGQLWIEYFLKSGSVSRDNLVNREYLYGKRNNFEKEFNTRITAIANQMQLGETNCYECKEDKIIKGTIMS